jgi:hypothetical protein
MAESTTSSTRRRDLLTLGRRLLAGAILLLLIVVVARSYLFADARVCRDVAAPNNGTVTVCGPAGPEDLPALSLALLVGLVLLMPDLGEIDLVGLVRLKRAVEQQGQQTEQLKNAVLALSIHQETHLNFYPKGLEAATEDIQRVESTARREGLAQALALVDRGFAAAPQAETAGQTSVPVEQARAEATIIRLWAGLEAKLGERPSAIATSPMRTIDDMTPREQWLALFGQDLETFRAVRNSVAHRPDSLIPAQLEQAVALGQRLSKSLDDWLSGRVRAFTR